MSTRIGLTVSDEMDVLLEQIADQERRPKSEVVREAIEDYLRRRGIQPPEKLQWGGKRERSVDED